MMYCTLLEMKLYSIKLNEDDSMEETRKVYYKIISSNQEDYLL